MIPEASAGIRQSRVCEKTSNAVHYPCGAAIEALELGSFPRKVYVSMSAQAVADQFAGICFNVGKQSFVRMTPTTLALKHT